jgi:hypothetical protein
MTKIREKMIAKYKGFGGSPPDWTRSRLGRADNAPIEITGGLDLAGFQGKGEDWLQDIYDLLRIATRSRILHGMYSDPVPYRDRNGIAIGAAEDVYGYSIPVMLRMIKSTLWAAEQQGMIAMPSRLRVDVYPNGKGVWVNWS